MGVAMAVLEGKRPEVPHVCPELYQKMMARCWHPKPEKRPDMSEVVDFLSQISNVNSIV